MPRRESMPRNSLLGKRRSECDGVVKVRITAATEVILCLGLITIVTFKFGEVVVHLTQPCGMRRLVNVFQAPREFLTRGLSLTKEARKLRVDDASNPVHDKNLASRQLLCLLEDCDCFLHIAIAAQE